MSVNILKHAGDVLTLTSAEKLMSRLDKGIYLIKYNQELGFHLVLKSTDLFPMPPKIYGNPEQLADYYLEKWSVTDSNIGIHLTGLKGTGKTVLAQMIANKCGGAILIMTDPFAGQAFLDFISSPVFRGSCLLLDEFEKMYDHDVKGQNKKSDVPVDSLLTLFDGMLKTKLLFIATSNNPEISEYFINRPGRILYTHTFSGLDDDTIFGVVEDLVKDPQRVEEVIDSISDIKQVSMDVLVKVAEEAVLRPEVDLPTILSHMNVKVEKSDYNLIAEVSADIDYETSSGKDIELEAIPLIKNCKIEQAITDFIIPKQVATQSVEISLDIVAADYLAKHLISSLGQSAGIDLGLVSADLKGSYTLYMGAKSIKSKTSSIIELNTDIELYLHTSVKVNTGGFVNSKYRDLIKKEAPDEEFNGKLDITLRLKNIKLRPRKVRTYRQTAYAYGPVM